MFCKIVDDENIGQILVRQCQDDDGNKCVRIEFEVNEIPDAFLGAIELGTKDGSKEQADHMFLAICESTENGNWQSIVNMINEAKSNLIESFT